MFRFFFILQTNFTDTTLLVTEPYFNFNSTKVQYTFISLQFTSKIYMQIHRHWNLRRNGHMRHSWTQPLIHNLPVCLSAWLSVHLSFFIFYCSCRITTSTYNVLMADLEFSGCYGWNLIWRVQLQGIESYNRWVNWQCSLIEKIDIYY